jgi:hypothetical protein
MGRGCVRGRRRAKTSGTCGTPGNGSSTRTLSRRGSWAGSKGSPRSRRRSEAPARPSHPHGRARVASENLVRADISEESQIARGVPTSAGGAGGSLFARERNANASWASERVRTTCDTQSQIARGTPKRLRGCRRLSVELDRQVGDGRQHKVPPRSSLARTGLNARRRVRRRLPPWRLYAGHRSWRAVRGPDIRPGARSYP